MKKLEITLAAITLLLSLFATAQTSFAISTREQMMAIAGSYANYTWTPTEDNVCSNKCCVEWDEEGKCSKEMDCLVSTPDRNTNTDWSDNRGWKWEKNENGNYLQNIAVPYQWGGSSSIKVDGISLKNMPGFGDFNTGIENKKCAGDARDEGSRSKYAVGVDCSGFVSRSWNLKSKKSTWTLPNISKKLENYDDLKSGDILNRTVLGRHVMLFSEFLDSESTHKKLRVYESMGHYWKVRTSDYDIANLRDIQKYKPYTPFPSDIDVEIVVDISKSMEGSNAERAIDTLNYLVDKYSAGSNSRVGVIGFSYGAAEIYPLTKIEDKKIASEIKNKASDYINSHLGGETNVAKGLSMASEKLKSVESGEAYKNVPKLIILISDGYATPEDTEDPDFISINTVLNQLVQDKIKVDAIRTEWEIYFDEPLLSMVEQESQSSTSNIIDFKKGKLFETQLMMEIPDRDYSNFSNEIAREYMKYIAEKTRGKYQYVSNLDSFYEMCAEPDPSFYPQEKTLKTMQGKINQNQTIFRNYLVDPSLEDIVFFIFWPGSELDFKLIQPDGVEITSDFASDDIAFSSSSIYKTYKIGSPMNGLWQLKIYGKEVSSGGEDYIVAIKGISGINLDASLDKEKYSISSPIKISASVIDQILDTDEIQYIHNAQVEAEIKDPDGNIHNIDLYDADDDGIYTGEFSNTSIDGQYDFTIEFSGNSNLETAEPFIREKAMSAIITPDLPPIANAGGPYEGVEGQEITFDASASSDSDGEIILYEWDFDGDGIYNENSTLPTANHIYPDDYNGIVNLRITDGDGFTDIASSSVNVKNANPIVNAGENQTAEVFDEVTLAGNFADSGWLDTHSASIDWGDGIIEDILFTEENSAPNARGEIIAAHIYEASGNYTVKLAVQDDDGGIGEDEIAIIINKRETNLQYVGEISGQYSDKTKLKAILADKDGALADKLIHFTIGDQFTSASTNSEGIAEAEITLNQIPGNYMVESEFEGDEYYFPFSNSKLFKILKEGVILEVENQEGFFGEEIILRAIAADNDEDVLYSAPNKISFAIGDRQIGEAIINEIGQAMITWTVNLVSTNLSETYPITVTFDENEYYLSAQGRGEFTLKSAKQLKQAALNKLKTVQSNDKHAQKDIGKAIEDIENSLEEELWIDASHLDPKHGHKVFDREKQAIKSLLKIIEERGNHKDLEIASELQIVINDLAKADILLAKAAIYDLENMEIDDNDLRKKIDDRISRAKEELEKGIEKLADKNPDKALDYLKKAWKLAQGD